MATWCQLDSNGSEARPAAYAKPLDQMNLQLHRVLSDITGQSGQRILDAILAGERDPLVLARLCYRRVRSSHQTIAKALEGDYRSEHLFALKQSFAGYRYYQKLIAEADGEMGLHRRPPHRRGT
jgi:hypothetical protein